ncbi:hypothetical protein Agub_g6697, partial [Astrephomene gubernaculifera]
QRKMRLQMDLERQAANAAEAAGMPYGSLHRPYAADCTLPTQAGVGTQSGTAAATTAGAGGGAAGGSGAGGRGEGGGGGFGNGVEGSRRVRAGVGSGGVPVGASPMDWDGEGTRRMGGEADGEVEGAVMDTGDKGEEGG